MIILGGTNPFKCSKGTTPISFEGHLAPTVGTRKYLCGYSPMCQNIAMGFTGEHLNPSPTKKPAPLNDPAAQAASFQQPVAADGAVAPPLNRPLGKQMKRWSTFALTGG